MNVKNDVLGVVHGCAHGHGHAHSYKAENVQHFHVHGHDERNDVDCVNVNVVTSSSDWGCGCTCGCLNWWTMTVDEAEDSVAAAYVNENVVVVNEHEKCEDEAGSVVDDLDDDVNDLDPDDDSEVWTARPLSGFFASWVSGLWLWAEIDFRLHLHSQYYDFYLHVS